MLFARIARWTLLALTAAGSATIATAGNGKVRVEGGVKLIDFCVSIRFAATQTQIDQIRTAFTNANAVLADSTDGALRFGRIGIVNNSGASNQSEVWIHSGTGGAYATYGDFGVPGSHITMFMNSNFEAAFGADGDAYTIAHEFGHHLWGLGDEYKSNAGGAAECEPVPGSVTASFSLMDNYFTRGGQATPGGGQYTLNEFCVSSNHDPDLDTVQSSIHAGKSCWEVIASHPNRSIAAPALTPTDAGPAVTAPEFRLPGTQRRFILCVDRSGSMGIQDAGSGTPTRLEFAKQAARIFVQLTRPGDAIGVTSFATTASTNLGLTTLLAPEDTAAALAAVNGLVADGSTAIGSGLIQSREVLLNAIEGSCAQTIVLLTDGLGNTGPSELSVIPSLIENDISVIAIAIGSSVSVGNLQQVAVQTGGRFYQVSSAAGLPALLTALTSEASGGGILANAPGSVAQGSSVEQVVFVDPMASSELRFVLSWATPGDNLNLVVRSPDGSTYSSGPAAFPSHSINQPGFDAIVLQGAEAVAGAWEVRVLGQSVSGVAQYDLTVQSNAGNSKLLASSTKLSYVYPEPIALRVVPQWEGFNVLGARVRALVRRPNGSTSVLPFRDDGSLGSLDDDASDGSYSARLQSFGGEGVYDFEIVAEVVDAMTYGGEPIFNTTGVQASSFPVPDFQRLTSYSLFVAGAPSQTEFPCFKVHRVLSNSFAGIFVANAAFDAGQDWDPASEDITLTITDPDFGVVYSLAIPAGSWVGSWSGQGVLRYLTAEVQVSYSSSNKRLAITLFAPTGLTSLNGPTATLRLDTLESFAEATIPLNPLLPPYPGFYTYSNPSPNGCTSPAGQVQPR